MSQVTFAILGALAFCTLYLIGRTIRSVIAWGNRDPGPKERVGFYLVLAVVMGATAGWLAYEPIAAARQCQAAGQPVIPCAFLQH